MNDSSTPTSSPTAAVVLAAGQGKRMKSPDKAKVLHTAGGRCLLSHAVRAVAALQPEYVVVVAGHRGAEVEATARQVGAELGQRVAVAHQQQLLGSGHAVECALAELPDDPTGPVLVTAGDVPLVEPEILWGLYDVHVDAAAAVTVLTTTVAEPHGYGRIVRDGTGEFVRIVEELNATDEQRHIDEVNSGIYFFDAEFLAQNLHRLETDSGSGERYLTGLVEIARSEQLVVRTVHCTDHAQLVGVNTPEQLDQVADELNRRIVERWRKDGVTIPDPSSVRIDVDVVIGPGSVLHPHVRLHGSTRIGSGAVVGPDTTLTDYVVNDGAEVRDVQLVGQPAKRDRPRPIHHSSIGRRSR